MQFEPESNHNGGFDLHVRDTLPVPQGVVSVLQGRESFQPTPADFFHGITAAAAALA